MSDTPADPIRKTTGDTPTEQDRPGSRADTSPAATEDRGEEVKTDTADLSIGEYDRSSGRR